jgi:N-acetylmuramoyl-L-alanine amidase
MPPPRAEPAAAATASLRGATIVVDPGHGGHDPGAQGRSPIPEKTINLDIGRRVAQFLEANGANVTVSRSGDRFIELDGRAALAERTHADLFVSIHADSARRSSADGMTIYVARNSSSDSRRAAQCIAQALQSAGFEVRGVQSAGYRVLVAHSRPAVLVECGFLSNEREAHLLASPDYRARVAEAIAAGIADYFH